MNICIVTVYRSINSGSFWQAYALGRVLESMGHNVFYYKNPTMRSSSSPYIYKKVLLKTFLKCGTSEAIRYCKSVKEFRKIQKEKFDIIDSSSKIVKDIDYFIVGSDTVWNVKDAYFSKWINLFSGSIFPSGKLLSYAVSAGNSSFSESNESIRNATMNYKSLSVRDEHTQKELKKLTERDSIIVCDPTLLLEKNDDIYNQSNDLNLVEPYIFIYLFIALTKYQEKELLGYARQRGYRIVSTLRKEYAPYTDEVVINTPMNFCECMRNAKIVITDTYHGTLFSLLFRKQFVTINRNKVTVNSIMNQLELEERLASDNNFRKVLDSEIDYQVIEEKIDSLRKISYEFLKENLKDN